MLSATKRLFAPVVIFLSLVAVVAVGGLIFSGVVLAQQGNVSPVTNIAVCSGPTAGEVIVSWDSVSQAAYYRIGYVNMVKDYPRAKASATGEWIEAFVYVDVNARNIPVSGGRGQYTLRRLVPGDRHAFTVLISDNVVNTVETISGAYSWPQNPRWEFHTVTNPQSDCNASAPPTVRLTPTPTPSPTPTQTPRPTPTPTRMPTPTRESNAVSLEITECADGRQVSNTAAEIIIRGNLHALRTVTDVVVYGSAHKSNLPKTHNYLFPPINFNRGFDDVGDMARGERRSFDVSYIHNGSISGNSCYVSVFSSVSSTSNSQTDHISR